MISFFAQKVSSNLSFMHLKGTRNFKKRLPKIVVRSIFNLIHDGCKLKMQVNHICLPSLKLEELISSNFKPWAAPQTVARVAASRQEHCHDWPDASSKWTRAAAPPATWSVCSELGN